MRVLRSIPAALVCLVVAVPAMAQQLPTPPAAVRSCQPGTACFKQLRAHEEYLDERQRARQLRQFSIDQGRALRNQGVYPGYSDNNIPVFQPRNPGYVDPFRR